MGTNIRTIYRTNTKRSSKQLKRRRVRARKVYGLPTFACRAQNNADRTQTMGGRERTYHQVARMSALRTSTTAQASPRSQRRRVFSNRVGAQRATFINLTAMETDECARVYLDHVAHNDDIRVRFFRYTLHHMQLFVRRLSSGTTVLVAIGLFFSSSSVLDAQSGLPQGCRQPTAADIAAGLPPDRPVCAPDSATVGDSGEAKRFLASIMRGGSCGPYRSTVEQLNPGFAVCAARFLKEVKQRDPRLRIVSAYRSTAHQAFLCGGGCGRVNGPCAAAGSSKHQQGRAIDISVGTHIVPGWIQAMGRGYGVHFPVRNDSGHMEPMGGNCADPNFRPTDTGGRPPTSGIAGAARQALNIPPYDQSFGLAAQPAGQSSQEMCTLPDGWVVPCSTIANRGGAPAQGGTSVGGAPAQSLPASQQPLSYLQEPAPVSNLITPPAANIPIVPGSERPSATTTKYSVIEQIGFLAAPEQAPTATTTPFVLTVSARDAAFITQTQQRPAPTPNDTVYLPPEGTAQQTFTSPDLSLNPPSGSPAGARSATQTILAQFRDILSKALQLLRPFGRIHGPEDIVWE